MENSGKYLKSQNATLSEVLNESLNESLNIGTGSKVFVLKIN